MNILVTGGCGFIGSNFIRYMLEEKVSNKILNLDKLTYAGQGKNIEHMGLKYCRYVFKQGDINNSKLVNKILGDYSIDAIVNFAAESHVDRSIKDSSPFMDTNVKGTQILLDAAVKNKIKKFIQIGTDEVYGDLGKDSPSSKEGDPIKPSSPYSASKASADLWALSFYKTHDLPVCVTRSANNYGPYQFPEKVIPLFITNLMAINKVPLYGEGENIREWIYVDDNCGAIASVLENGKPGEIYNIGSGNQTSNIDLTKKILSEMDFDERMIEKVKDRPGHDFRYNLNCEKIKKELGWKPEIDFDDGIKQTIEWYKENKRWWFKLKYGE